MTQHTLNARLVEVAVKVDILNLASASLSSFNIWAFCCVCRRENTSPKRSVAAATPLTTPPMIDPADDFVGL